MKYSMPMTHRFSRELRIFARENNDTCTKCGYHFKSKDTGHLGYDLEDNFIYCCDSCINNLKETVIRYYISSRSYTVPENSVKLWRYFDFSKYVSLLSQRALFFSSAKMFNDPFEGAKGIIDGKAFWDNYYLEQFKIAARTIPGQIKVPDESEVEMTALRMLESLNSSGEKSRDYTYINCWHENDCESDAMWRLYSKDNYSAVAIQSTYRRLYESLDKDPDIQIGRVNYINYNKRYVDPNDAYWFKRDSFAHEKEVRAIVHNYENTSNGVYIPITLERLIENVHVSPLAPSWLLDLVNEINGKYNLEVRAKKSSLLQTPFY